MKRESSTRPDKVTAVNISPQMGLAMAYLYLATSVTRPSRKKRIEVTARRTCYRRDIFAAVDRREYAEAN